MKKMIYLLAIILGIVAIHMPIHAEFIVMKQTKEGFAPLDEDNDDIDESKMQRVLMACQWPMDISSHHKDVQAEEVLKPNNARIEERVAERVIANCSLFEKGDPAAPSFRIIFFPTCLYELFVICEAYMGEKNDNPLQKAIEKVYTKQPDLWPEYAEGTIDLKDLIKSNDPQAVRKKMNDRYMKVNKIFMGGSDTAYVYINHKLAAWLLSEYPHFKQSTDSAALSDAIQKNIEEIKTKLIGRLTKLSEPMLAYEPRGSNAKQYGKQLINTLKQELGNRLISSYIALEYEARELNKGILIRGTSFEEFNGHEKDQDQKMIAGSTVLQKEVTRNGKEESPMAKPFEQVYKAKETTPYSVSFGNYLFAGALRDRTACAYTFLTGERVYSSASDSTFKAVGYAVLIDKKDYVEHQNSQLFFIPPISPLASLFLRGEFFHARSKAAIALKPQGAIRVQGVFGHLEDPTGVILITRDPLKHAALFSQFLADNGRIIQAGDPSQLTEEEKKFAENVLNTQKDAAGYYKGIQYIAPKVDKLISETRERLELKPTQESK